MMWVTIDVVTIALSKKLKRRKLFEDEIIWKLVSPLRHHLLQYICKENIGNIGAFF